MTPGCSPTRQRTPPSGPPSSRRCSQARARRHARCAPVPTTAWPCSASSAPARCRGPSSGSSQGAPDMTDTAHIEVTVNGRHRALDVAVHHTLLDALRDDLRLTGTKECCLVGECGACTVIMDGRTVDSCLVLAVEADGGEITTVEGFAVDQGLSPLQQAFLDKGAVQCGFCIPG